MPDTDPTVNPEVKPDEGALGDAGKAALKAERDARAEAEKALKVMEDKISALEARDLSDLEKANKRAEAAEKAAAETALELHRNKAIIAHKLDPDFAGFLTGTADEIEAKAKTLAEKFARSNEPDPAVDTSQGAQGAAKKKSTAEAFSDAIDDLL